jgi:antitoxin component YwqK of YwqJK toxin-antitoxin module
MDDATVLADSAQETAQPVRDGVVETRNENDRVIQQTTYKNGVLDGQCTIFNEQGKRVQKLFYKNGLLDGETLVFDDDEQLVQQLAYQQGVFNGTNRVFDKGILITQIPYVKGMREGVARFFSLNGQLQTQITFLKDQEDGPCVVYDPTTGATLKTQVYSKGMLTGKSLSYYPDGAVMIQQTFKNGLLEDHEIYFYEDGIIQQITAYEKGIVTEPLQKFDTKGKEI